MTSEQRLDAALTSIASQVEQEQRHGARLLQTNLICDELDCDAIDTAVRQYLESAQRTRPAAIDDLRKRLQNGELLPGDAPATHRQYTGSATPPIALSRRDK